jgi:hypothetical protein
MPVAACGRSRHFFCGLPYFDLAAMPRALTTTTAKKDIDAFSFAQEGLMAGLGLQGTKISLTPLD